MAAQATFGIDITASDKTARGKKAAEKSLSQIPKNLGAANRKAAEDGERRIGNSGRRMVRTFGEVERAAARAFGGRSITGGLSERLGGIRQAASALGSGLGEASAAGGVLEGALGGVAVAGAATIGILAAGAYAAFKLADGWAKGAASIGRTAEIIGIGTKAFQEFTIAAERAGVSRDTAAGAVGGLSQTLNDARYGRNNEALSVLARMGVTLKTKGDGTVDVEAMLPQIADAIARQSSSGRLTAARHLGIPVSALPAFTQGAKKLSADMADASKRGPVISEEGIAKGKKLARRDTIGAQMLERATNSGKELLADGVDTVGTAVISSARSMVGSSRTNERAADKMDRAAGQIERAINTAGGGAGRLSQQAVISEARKGLPLRSKLIAAGFSEEDASALAANAVRESGADHARQQRGGPGYGLWQWGSKNPKFDRRLLFQRVMGKSIYGSSEDDQIKFLKWELSHTEAAGWRRAHAAGSDRRNVAAGFALEVERMKDTNRDPAERAAVAAAMPGPIPVKVDVHLHGGRPGDRVVTKAGHGPSPAVSHAMPAFMPVHGG